MTATAAGGDLIAPKATSCSSVALQTDLSRTLDSNIDEMQVLFKQFYSRFMDQKKPLKNIFISMEKVRGLLSCN